MADTLESLEIEVKHSASGAAGEISGIANAVHDLGSQLSKVLPSLKELANTLSKVKGNISVNINSGNGVPNSVDPQHSSSGNPSDWAKEMQSAVEFEDKGFLDSLKNAADTSGVESAMNAAKGAVESVGNAAEEAAPKVMSFAQALFQTVKKDIGAVGSVLSSIAKGFRSIGRGVANAVSSSRSAINEFRESIKSTLSPLSNFLSSLKRIAYYRFIRRVIKAITEVFSEGLKNAYAFSQASEADADRFAAAMDSMSSASLKMKNQLGSAFAAVLALIAPIVNAIISLVIRLANALSQLFGAFTGNKYIKANDVASQFADNMERGAGAAKEWKNQLLGFDELNRLNDPSQGGGGGGALADINAMFESAEIEQRFKDFANEIKTKISQGDWEGIGKLLGDKINSIFPSDEKWREWGEKLGRGLDSAAKVLRSTLATIDFDGIGSKLAEFINGALGKIDFTVWGSILVQKTTLAIDFLLGFLGTLDWGLVGKSIGDFFRGAFDTASNWLLSKDWSNIGSNVFTKFKELIEGIDFASLADSFFRFLGIAFGAAVQFLDGFLSDTIQGIKDYFRKKTEEAGGDAWEGFKKGIKDAWANVKDWCKEHIVDPFVNGVKDLLGIHSPSTVFANIGGDIISGLQNGLTDMWSGVERWISDHFGWLISWCQSACNWLDSVLVGIGLVNGANLGSTWQTGGGFSGRSGKFAEGGFPDEGQLFMAREAGPELVGTMGGRTAVANNDQIVEGIRQGVYDAVLAANANNGGGGEFRLYLDSKQIKYGLERVDRAWGV